MTNSIVTDQPVGARFEVITANQGLVVLFVGTPPAPPAGGVPAPDGTVALPQGYNFLNELGLGFYRPSAGLIGLAQGGLKRVVLGFDGVRNVVDTGTGRLAGEEVFSPSHIDLTIAGGNLATRVDVPAVANDTALTDLLLKDSTGAFAAKSVAQGAADSAGVGFRSLVVPNDGTQVTAVVAGDFALTNWGVAPAVDVTDGSTCRRGNFRIIAGVGATNVFTWVLTFPTPFAAVPFAIVMHNDFNTLSDGSQVRVTATATTTDLTVVGFGDPGAPVPVTGSDYHFTWMVME